ncbi:Cnl2/NKP2 family protein-domain-containing protein [Aspergillus insuetus]
MVIIVLCHFHHCFYSLFLVLANPSSPLALPVRVFQPLSTSPCHNYYCHLLGLLSLRNNMAPSEPSILANFLLAAASLPTILSLKQFTELFPKRLRTHPHIRVLYRELQQLREQDMDIVNENIDREVRQGESQKAELRKSIAKTGIDGADPNDQREMDMDVQLFGPTSASSDQVHSVSSLLSAMETASASVEHEIAAVDEEAAALLSELNSTVGDLSDLRYGKMHGSVGATDDEVVSEAIRGLVNLEDACYRKSAT